MKIKVIKKTYVAPCVNIVHMDKVTMQSNSDRITGGISNADSADEELVEQGGGWTTPTVNPDNNNIIDY